VGASIHEDALKAVETLSNKSRDPAVSFLSKKVQALTKLKDKMDGDRLISNPTPSLELPMPVRLELPE
jgi:hypothetical protein